VVVQPTAVIGPFDYKVSMAGKLVRMVKTGHMPVNLAFGGYNFVDVRDLAAAIAASASDVRAAAGSVYILGGDYITCRDLISMIAAEAGREPPKLKLGKSILEVTAPATEAAFRLVGQPPLLTPYALEKLSENGVFDCAKAKRDLGFAARPLRETIRDMLAFIDTEK